MLPGRIVRRDEVLRAPFVSGEHQEWNTRQADFGVVAKESVVLS